MSDSAATAAPSIHTRTPIVRRTRTVRRKNVATAFAVYATMLQSHFRARCPAPEGSYAPQILCRTCIPIRSEAKPR